ncbi:Fc.00g066910.m01.CDS01 [Cosmosporella sp. VM-42]
MSAAFPMFLRLPAEIRNMVWAYALPEPRVFEILDTPHANLKTSAEAGLTFANKCHESPPALAGVCRESRAFVLHQYKALTLSGTTKYLSPSHDIILLEPYLLIRRLLRALHFLSQIRPIRDQIRQLALGTSYGFSTGISHPVLSGKVSKNNTSTLLGKLAKFPRLKKLLFVVHQEFQFSNPGFVLPSWSYRLQLFHHNYPFKFDTEVGIHPFSCPQNEFQYYPLKLEESKDDEIDLNQLEDEEEDEWRDRRPTNDDWRRFRRRFLKAMYLALEKGPKVPAILEQPALRIEGAGLLWRYHRN